ncbi:hypothetical protein NP233_g12710 [Leucocoprinus birnbaumii]|uniref:Small ribosomal subunit protein uS5m n=1 Tax=Leucocoprinus birnbaumii TaxID=56174 RepID=A0AAD5VGE6_9AGAR|nr:hypothetical protein NP233_g12710 [Leucocoprinus birnbaumii]
MMEKFYTSVLLSHRIVHQTGKGKVRSHWYLVLTGNGNSLVGYGQGKHAKPRIAIQQARAAAIKNMDYVERFEERTVWTEMSAKLGATKLVLCPRPVGFGLRCNPSLHQVLRAAGFKDISAKVWGSRNKMNVIKCAFMLLQAGHAPPGMGDGIGGKGAKLSRGVGMMAPIANAGPLTWLITGTSLGFGYRLALIALSRGDNSKKERLKTFQFDLSDSEDVVKQMVEDAHEVWGRIDVLVNNAGWAWRGMLEESGVSALQTLTDTNIIGTAKITFAVLPYMHARRTGTVVTISRMSWKAELPSIGSYAMVKSALRAFSENLGAELAPFNIRTLIVEPGSFRTEGIYSPGWHEDNLTADYDDLRKAAQKTFASLPGNEPGDALKAMTAVVDVVRGEGPAKGKAWPNYLILGEDGEAAVWNKCAVMLDVLEEGKDVTRGTRFS